jgi:hypothetical protein
MVHRLALALGKTVGELDRTMTVREFQDWRKFEAEQPLPDRLGDLQNALLATVAANIMRSSDSPPATLSDFLILKDRAEAENPPYNAVPTDSPKNEGSRFKIALGGR